MSTVELIEFKIKVLKNRYKAGLISLNELQLIYSELNDILNFLRNSKNGQERTG